MKMIDRITSIYRKNIESESRDHIWDWCFSNSAKSEITASNLDDMANNHLGFGYFGIGSAEVDKEALIKLARSLGIFKVKNPEGGIHTNVDYDQLSNSDILLKIEDKIGFNISLPPFIGNRKVLMTDRGIITDRHCAYLWIVKRIIELLPDRNSAIIEIGGGLGLLGYFLDKVGYKDYTVIDLANANAIQTYFLSQNLPEREMILSSESNDPYDIKHRESLKLLHSTDFHNIPKDRFNIMINIDGMTEMGIETARGYMSSDCAPIFLSINHEVNAYKIIDIYKPFWELKYRYPFWIRDGYVEELFERL